MAHPHQRAWPARGASRMALDANSLGNGVPRFRSPEDGYPLRSHGWHAQKPTHMLSHPHARPPALRLTALANARLTACLPVPSPSAASARCARQLSVASSTQSASVWIVYDDPRSPRRCQQPRRLPGLTVPSRNQTSGADVRAMLDACCCLFCVRVSSELQFSNRVYILCVRY